MSIDNIAIVKKAYDDFTRGDISAILEAVDDSVEWITPEIDLPTGGVRRGKAGVAEFFQAVGETWEFQALEPQRGRPRPVHHGRPQHRPHRHLRLGDGLDHPQRQDRPIPGVHRYRRPEGCDDRPRGGVVGRTPPSARDPLVAL
jgi:hypothetical protein